MAGRGLADVTLDRCDVAVCLARCSTPVVAVDDSSWDDLAIRDPIWE